MAAPRDALTALFDPAAVAIVGVADDPKKLSRITLRNLVQGGYAGRIYPVSRRLTEVEGLHCYPDMTALPEAVDVAFLALPAAATAAALRECAAAGARVAIIGSAGFAESGGEGVALQAELVAIAAQSGIRIVGPNCNGVYSATHRLALGFNTGHSKPFKAGNVALLSHSGALFDTMAGMLTRLGAGLSFFVSAGNEADLDLLDYMEYALQDPATGVVALLLDSLSDGPRFRRLAGRAGALGKHIVVFKIGVSPEGAAAAEAHCSRLASPAAAYRALFDASGVAVAQTLEGLMTAAALLSLFGRRTGGLGALTVSGAGAAILVDSAGKHGVPLTRYADRTQAELDARKMFGSVGNPTDYGVFGALRSAFGRVPGLVAEDPGVAVVLTLVHSMNDYQRTPYIEALAAARPAGKPILVLTPGGLAAEERAAYEVQGFCCLGDTDSAMQGIAALLAPTVADAPADAAPLAPAGSREPVLQTRRPLNEPDSLALLARYDLPVVATVLCAGLDQALAALERFGGPVAFKAVRTGVSHKTDLGLVRVGIRDAAAMRQAYVEFGSTAATVVQPMVEGKLEAIIGLKRTFDLGLFMVAGLGGIHAEALRDVTLWPVPVARERLESSLAETALGRVLRSARWPYRASFQALVATLLKLQAFALLAADEIEAVDINPLIIGADGCTAVDGLIVPRTADHAIARRGDGAGDAF